tara:strand:+ start:1737 stop:2162 length:426 start_codon:yes stop_codon:yes gene_type:complete
MNRLLLFLIGIPALEIFVMIKIGQNIGALSTVSLIFLTAIVGIYFAKIEGLNTLRSGVYNLYKNKSPVFEIISGASIAFAALLLIIPGFMTDIVGFLLLIPFTRKIIINSFIIKENNFVKKNEKYIDGEIVNNKKKEEDEL